MTRLTELNKREIVLQTLERKKTGYIPVISPVNGFAIANSPYGNDCHNDPRKFAEAMISAKSTYGFDALWAGVFKGVTAFMGQGLTDKNGKISETGDGTIRQSEDLKKMRPFNIEKCPKIHYICDNIRLLKKAQPEDPIIVAMDNPSMTAAALMDSANYYHALIHAPSFVNELTEKVFEPLVQCATKMIATGADIIWLPLATIGGCISRTHYQEFCMPYNKRFNQKITEAGAHLILHTCGNWNDRFDLVATEGAHCLHVAETDLGELKKRYGKTVAFMGQIPSVFTMMMAEPGQVFEECLKECLAASEGGGFILSADCALPAKTPADNIRAMVRAAREAEIILHGK